MKNARFMKFISVITLIGMLFLSTTVYANDSTSDSSDVIETPINDTEEIDHGTTPDQALYFFDRLLEGVQLAFTLDEFNKAALLASITEERKAEVSYLIEKAKNEEVEVSEWEKILEGVVSDYVEKLEETLVAIEEVSLIINDEEKAEFDEIIARINKVTNLKDEESDETIEEDGESQYINEELQDVIEEIIDENKELQEAIEKAVIVANVVQDLDKEQVIEMRDRGLGFGQISQVFALAEASGKEITGVASLFIDEGMGLGDASKELGLSTSEVAKSKALEKKLNAQAKAEEKYQNTIEKIEKKQQKTQEKAEKKNFKGKENDDEEENHEEDSTEENSDAIRDVEEENIEEDNTIEDEELDEEDEVKVEDEDEKKQKSKKNNPKENKKR